MVHLPPMTHDHPTMLNYNTTLATGWTQTLNRFILINQPVNSNHIKFSELQLTSRSPLRLLCWQFSYDQHMRTRMQVLQNFFKIFYQYVNKSHNSLWKIVVLSYMRICTE